MATMADYAQMFGQIMSRKYDMGTQVATAVQQGAQNFRCVRVTDGTDTAAYNTVPGSNASFTALYTGVLGNSITVTLGVGSKPGTWLLSVLAPGLQPELYDGLTGNGAVFWSGLATAVNSGMGPPARTIPVHCCHFRRCTTASPAPFSVGLG